MNQRADIRRRLTANARFAASAVAVVAAAAGTTAEAATQKCGLAPRNTVKGLYRVNVVSCPAEIPVNSATTWTVRVTTRARTPVRGRVAVTGGMPDHGHGFLTPPVVTRTASPGVYRARLVFAMPGRWVIELRIAAKGRRDVVRFQVVV